MVHPVEGQISYPNALPHVPHLAAGAVNNMCHLVGNDEFQVLDVHQANQLNFKKKNTYLGGEFIPDKKCIFYFDGPHKVILGISVDEILGLWNSDSLG